MHALPGLQTARQAAITTVAMPDPEFSESQMKLHEILAKIFAYQRSLLPEDRPVELDELERQKILSPEDIEFMSTHSVVYKPHKLFSYHAMDTFQMPTEDGGCVFTGISVKGLEKKHRTPLRDFGAVIERFLQIPRPEDELLLHVELEPETDGMAVAPGLIIVNFRTDSWKGRLPTIRQVALELGLEPFQDEEKQGSHGLTYKVPKDAVNTSTIFVALLSRGCGFADDSEIVYLAGALDEN
jgi:hypothetical protein